MPRTSSVGLVQIANGGTGAITAQAAAANLSTLFILAKWGVPFIVASTGTMGNNGAVSAMTALPATFSNGAWLYLPAGAVAAGVPAAASWLWFVASSATAGTVYNSTYTSGVPTPGTTTAFATTGPGAFTGVTTEVTGPQITIPANSLGTAGHLRATTSFALTNNANAKSAKVKLGATDFTGGAMSLASAANQIGWVDIFATGATNQQIGREVNLLGSNVIGIGSTYNGAIDMTTSQTLAYTFTRSGAATDSYVFEFGEVTIEN